MEVVYGRQVSSNATMLKHRGSGLGFKDFFKGSEDDVPNNYYFVLASQEAFYSPVHRHNFDQFRFGVKGTISILPDMNVGEGDLCYHPEGVQYGPQDDGEGYREVLVLQFGGASGQGYLSHSQLGKAQKDLAERGEFAKGKFYPHSNGEKGGEPEGIDGFQATWEHAMGRPLVYPEGRYDRPIKMHTPSYEWKTVKGQQGEVYKKTLGVFSERETRAEMWKIGKGTWEIVAENATQLMFVLTGKGSIDGKPLEEEAAVRLTAGTTAEISSEEGLELLRFVLPLM